MIKSIPDQGTVDLLNLWLTEVRSMDNLHLYSYVVKGAHKAMNDKGLMDVWHDHHKARGDKVLDDSESLVYRPPIPFKPTNGGGVDYTIPQAEFM
jgi:hypothetical protein